IEAGIPRFGVDMDTSNRMPETTLERESVSYDKGCYLGQEVIAKLRAYSTVKLALVGLVLEAGEFPPIDSTLYLGENEIGVLKSAVFSPTLGKPIALAYLDRDHRAPGAVLELRGRARGGEKIDHGDTGITGKEIGEAHSASPNAGKSAIDGGVRGCGDADQRGRTFSARVAVLPFYSAPAREERARALYEEALHRFERDAHDEDDTAIGLLREAVLLAPAFEDAYEALGVILNRHHRVDEAIHFMQILARLAPDSVMAHTNLSVFYVAKGMIPEAEDEKAKAAVLQMKHARQEREAEDIAALERERIRHEALERIAMFKEVLEFDPDDPLATFGAGMAYIQLNDYESALPHLERATQVQKDYSAAFLNLGKCLEFLQRRDEARAAYTAGIECASRKGDLMPMREMERRLKAL
ncbi:MAG: tetratricopeptide repeat protein, partial [Candidatus Hydrogenedentes bacterium]|nr:tetratricopeptide repeat protein [Candidatus Hydrogenedentota bacterium]